MSDNISSLKRREEHDLLLCCARTTIDEDTAQRIRSLASGPIDWDYLFRLARRHAIVPLVYTQLRQHSSDLMPAEDLLRFKKNYQENVARNQIFAAELVRIIKSLSAVGVQSLPFKGPTLALFAYSDPSLRRFVDLDVIVRREHVFKARDVLLQLGYETIRTHSSDQQTVLLRTQHSLQFKKGQILVELHWEVASHLFASTISGDELWQRLATLRLNDVDVNSLTAEDLLLSLCVHGSRHLWERLAWICDVAELINRHEIDWKAVMKRVSSTDSERMFYLGLYLARTLLGARLPEDASRILERDPLLPNMWENIRGRLFSGLEHVPATSRQIFGYNFKLRKSWRARARYVVYTLQPTDEDLAIRLPRPLTFAYYLVRPVRLMVSNRF